MPLPGYEVRLLDDAGNVILEDNRSGEAQVWSAGMMTGYKIQSPQPTGEWYPTGDVMIRVNGKYFVVGRLKELIKVNGYDCEWESLSISTNAHSRFLVAPAKLEAVLLSEKAGSKVWLHWPGLFTVFWCCIISHTLSITPRNQRCSSHWCHSPTRPRYHVPMSFAGLTCRDVAAQ